MFPFKLGSTRLAVFVLLAPGLLLAQQPQELKESSRAVYENTADIPNELYLPAFLNLLNARLHGRFEGDTSRLATYVRQKMFLHDDEEAMETTLLLLEAAESLNNEVDRHARTALCDNTQQQSFGQETFAALDAIDRLRANLGKKYLKRIEREFSDYRFLTFLSWMDNRKPSTTLIFLDHESSYRGRDPEVVRQNICRRLSAGASE